LAERIAGLDGYRLKFDGPFFNEFVVRTECEPRELLKGLRDQGILGGIDLSRYGLDNSLLIAVTEKRTREELDLLVERLKEL
ncbi:MAG: glycine dehydrogenase, partial [Candidatus Bipolaricaulia bacterium]